jgi:hypothetical protein
MHLVAVRRHVNDSGCFPGVWPASRNLPHAMALFDIDSPDAHIGYRNLRIGEFPVEREIKAGLEALWARYEPYADANFCQEFSRQPDNRFWEMYLTVRLLDAGKKIRSRAELPSAARDVGPDLCIQKGTRRIWIEAVSPEQGHANNPDRVADRPAEEARIDADEQRRQVELRITTALCSKIEKFKGYRNDGIIGERDSCIVAISAGQFALQAIHGGLPPPVTSVYPFGQEQAYFNSNARTFNSVFDFAPQIRRVGGQAVDRTAFQDPENALISGLIWSHRSIGNFLARPDDFVFVQNQVGLRPIRRIWLKWSQAYFVVNNGQQLWATKSLTNRRTFKISSSFR